MSKDFRNLFTDIGIVVVVLLLVLPFTCSRRVSEPSDKIVPDTIIIRDTLYIPEPKQTSEKIVGEEVVKLPKAQSELKEELKSEPKGELKNIPISNELDSIGELSNGLSNDSAEVVIPITERTYEDSTYKAVVRGYNPELVSLDIYNTTKYYPVVEKVKVKPKITISAGLYGGIGQKGWDYGLGVTVGYPIWSG